MERIFFKKGDHYVALKYGFSLGINPRRINFVEASHEMFVQKATHVFDVDQPIEQFPAVQVREPPAVYDYNDNTRYPPGSVGAGFTVLKQGTVEALVRSSHNDGHTVLARARAKLESMTGPF